MGRIRVIGLGVVEPIALMVLRPTKRDKLFEIDFFDLVKYSQSVIEILLGVTKP